MKEARRTGFITTMTGRRLYVDRSRANSALNYDVQSSSRDITGRGIIKLHRAGLTEYIRLPDHDEIMASLPAENAQELAGEIGRHMESTVCCSKRGLRGLSWGYAAWWYSVVSFPGWATVVGAGLGGITAWQNCDESRRLRRTSC